MKEPDLLDLLEKRIAVICDGDYRGGFRFYTIEDVEAMYLLSSTIEK